MGIDACFIYGCLSFTANDNTQYYKDELSNNAVISFSRPFGDVVGA